MPLKILYGRAGTGKTTQVLSRLCKAGEVRPQVLIVPEPQSHETERALCKMGGPGISCCAEVLSFTRLANRVFQEAGGTGLEELDAGGRLILMYNAVKNVSSAGGLRVYHRPSRHPAFLQALLSTVDELKSCCVLPKTLEWAGRELCEAQPEDEAGCKLTELGLICGEYDRLTQTIRLDPMDRLSRVAEKLDTCDWAAGKDIWVDGFTDFTQQQMEVLQKLFRQANSLTVALTCDELLGYGGETDEESVFAPAQKTAWKLLHHGKKHGIECKAEKLEGACGKKIKALCDLEKNLFSASAPQPCDAQGSVELFCASGARSEVEWTAARILQLVREEGYRFRDIGVCARNYGAYRDYVESVFPRYGIPVFSSAMSDILEKPVLALITAALDTVTGGYTYDDVFRYLKTGLTGLEQEECDLLENYVLKWNIRGSQWTQSKPWNWHPRGYGFQKEPQDEEVLARVDRARRMVAEKLELLKKNTDKTGRGQAKNLYAFLVDIGLPQRLEERVAVLKERGELALAGEYLQLWEIFCGGLEQCASLLDDKPMELEEFALLFRLVLSQYDVGTIPVSLDRVTAGEMTRQTGHRVKVMFLLGADDGSIPQAASNVGLLSEQDRALLTQQYQVELSQSRLELLYREMTTVYQICTLPDKKLVVTWPMQGESGAELRPSFLVERLRLLFPDVKVVREEDLAGAFRMEAPLPALEQAGRDTRARLALSVLPEYTDEVARLERAAQWERGKLSRRAVEKLYGSRIPMSASRMDKYRSCHFSYFMRYGLKAEPRKPAGFSAPEYGTFVHYVLEHVLGHEEYRAAGKHLDEDERCDLVRRLTDEAVNRYLEEELGGLQDKTPRFRYLFLRLLNSVRTVVDNAAAELADSSFEPIRFELGFGAGGEESLPPVELTVDGVTISVTGFVDRVDGWVHDGRLYLRVVDYKTGRKSFDLTEVWNGIGLQMLLYLFTLKEKGEAYFGLPVEEAGVLYFPARDAVVKGSRLMSEEALTKAVNKELVRSGLVLDDPHVLNAMEPIREEGYRFLPLKVSKSTGAVTGDALVTAERFGKLGAHIQRVLKEICEEMAAGNIAADPYWRGPDRNACRYCDYAAACHFEEGRGGDCRRWLSSVKPQEFWENVENRTRNAET